MSMQNLKEYASRCAAEPELREKAKAIGMEDIEEHIRLSSSMGLDWDYSDMQAFRKEIVDASENLEDLSEEELEQVAGGLFSVTLVASLAAGAAVGTVAGAAVGGAAAGGAAAAGGGGW